jgi:pimeloyl-ACP methyl ester carboxylesterase
VKSAAETPTTVVLVPGVGFGGLELRSLAQRLRRAGFAVAVFPHMPGRCPLAESVRRLHDFVSALGVESFHFVAHSMGGRVVLRMLSEHPQSSPGRIVLLGTPLQHALTVKRVLTWPGGWRLLGAGVESLGTDAAPLLPPGWAIAAIAGRLNVVFGWLLGLGETNDTLIRVSETRHPGLTAQVVLTASHGSMLILPGVARNVAYFLQTGSFP